MIKKMSNELWYSTITSKGYPTAELAEEAETRVYAGVLNRAYSVRNWIAQYTALCEMYEKDCNKGDRSNEAVFNEYEPKFDSIIQTLYEAGVNKLDGCSLIDVLNSNRLDDVDYEDDEDNEDDDYDESDVESSPERIVVAVHRVSRSNRRRPNRYDNCNKCNKDCDDCN